MSPRLPAWRRLLPLLVVACAGAPDAAAEGVAGASEATRSGNPTAAAAPGDGAAVPGGGGAGAAAPGRAPLRLRPVAAADLDVTLGALRQEGSRLLVEAPKLRAVLRRVTAQTAELRFTYLGPTREVAPLASGEKRRQLGLKLRAADGCNLIYVMWRLEPRPALVVSTKRNPGARRHSECGAGGYRNVRPVRAGPLPPLVEGASHVLRAELEGDRLLVLVDGSPAWEGRLGAEVGSLAGPVGLRTDNVRIAFELHAP